MVSENEFLLHAFFMGIYITFLYDILRIFRNVIRHSRFWESVEDMSFWIYCSAKVFLLMHHESDGTLRWFAVTGALVGIILYKKTIGPLLVKYTSRACCWIRDVLISSVKWLLTPFLKAGIKIAGTGVFRCQLKKKLTSLLKVFRM